MTLDYEYPRRELLEQPIERNGFGQRTCLNTVDLGLVVPGDHQVAATGPDKQSITLSETWATLGCTLCKLTPGTWQILAGAYRIAPEGVDERCTLTFEEKPLAGLRVACTPTPRHRMAARRLSNSVNMPGRRVWISWLSPTTINS